MLAVQTGINVSVLNEILKGKRGINADYAVAFELVLGIPAEMLMKLQSDFELFQARIKMRANRISD